MNDSTARTFTGWIETRENGEGDDVLFVSAIRGNDGEPPFSETLDFMNRKSVTVRYWVANEECSVEQASEHFIGTLMGQADVSYCVRYSEITGYLWTDDDLKIGGHDLIRELSGYEGRYLILQVEIHD